MKSKYFINVKRWQLILWVTAVLLMLPNFIPLHLNPLPGSGNGWEAFSPQTASNLQTVNQLATAIDRKAAQKQAKPSDTAYLNILSSIVQERFHHGYSHYSLAQNWIAALAGKVLWNHLSAIVLPADLMRYPMAACSQQSIVVMELLRRKGIAFRKVGFDHHFALEARCNNSWYFIDTNMEPDFTQIGRRSFAELQGAGLLPVVYANGLANNNLAYTLGNPYYGVENESAAPNAAIFHRVTKLLSRTLWLLPISILIGLYIRRKRLVHLATSKNRFAAEKTKLK